MPVFVPEVQSFVDTEDVLKAMSQHIKPDGLIHNMFIEFENTNIPVYSQDECRIVAHMAAAYHNACLAKTLSSEKDLYGKSYTQSNSKLHYICGPSCTGAADNPFDLREHPGYRLWIAGQNSESVETEEDTS